MNIRSWILGVTATALLLTGCTITIGGLPFPPTDDVTSITAIQSEARYATGTFSFQSDETRWFELSLTDFAQAQEAIFVELSTDANVGMTLYSTGGSTLAYTTRSEVFFASRTAASSASGASADVSPESISTPDTCEGGACVIRNASSPTFYLRVENFGSSRDITIYGYAREYYDEDDIANDSQANAVPISSTDTGAIERIGDVDYWEVQTTGDLYLYEFSGAPEIQRQVFNVTTGAGPYDPSSTPIFVVAGDIIRVDEAGGNAAGPAGFSGYTLEIQ